MRKKPFLKLIIVLLMLLTASGVTIAWLSTSLSNSISATASVHKAYFLGEGTEEDPYRIESPVQLYYFAWLQDLGYFNDDHNNGVSVAAPVYFDVLNDLDMTGFTLPPAGTSEYPFIGHFDGKGHTISNLNVMSSATSAHLTDVPNNPKKGNTIADSNYQILGVFGVVGEIGETYAANSFVPTVTDLNIASTTVYSETPDQNKTLVGIVAGYVNGKVEKVTIADSSVKVNSSGLSALSYTTNLSDYTVVGYCEEAFLKTLDVSTITFTEPTETENMLFKNTQAEGAAFGGSMKMDELYSRILKAYNAGSTPSTTAESAKYTSAENINYDEATGETWTTVTATASPSAPFSGTTLKYYQSDSHNATYSSDYYLGVDTSTTRFLYLTGTTKTITHVLFKNEYTEGFTISDGSEYLNINPSTNTITNQSVTGGPTGWIMDNNGRIYTYTSYGYKCYISATTSALSITTEESSGTRFTKSNDGYIYFTSGGTNYYIVNNNGWTVYNAVLTFYIKNGSNYLARNNNANGIETRTDTTRGEWGYDVINKRIYNLTQRNGTTYYLYANSSSQLALSNSTSTASTQWYVDEDTQSIYYVKNGVNWYIRYSNNSWDLFESSQIYKIAYNGNYLNRNNATTVNSTTTAGTNNDWTYNETTHKLFNTNNNKNYYLYVNSSNELALTTTEATGTEWYLNDNNTVSFFKGSEEWFLRYTNNAWNVYPAAKTYSISYNNNYLNNNGTTGIRSTNSASTEWIFDDAGQIKMFSSNNYYYLTVDNNNNLILSSSVPQTTWTIGDDNSLSITKNGTTLYLKYENNSWKVNPAKSTFFIHKGTYYLSNNGTTAVQNTNSSSACEWIIDEETGIIKTVISGNYYYLDVNGNNEIVLSNTERSTSFIHNDDGTITTTINSHIWYLDCQNGNWFLYPERTAYYIKGSTNYINVDNGNIVSSTTGSTGWFFEYESGSDTQAKVYTYYNGQKNYLCGTNQLTISTSNSTIWTHNNDGTYSYSYDNNTWYLFDMDGTWKVFPSNKLYYISQNGKYLNVNGSNEVVMGTSLSDATSWSWDSANGYLITTISNTNYYLCANNYQIYVSDNPSTVWSRDNNGGFKYNNGSDWHLIYDDGWTAYPTTILYYIYSGTNYLSHSGTSLVNTNSTDATMWLVDANNKYYFVHNNTRYYLRATSSGLSVVDNEANGTPISFDSSKNMVSFIDSFAYYIIYNNQWTVLSSRRFYISTTSGGTTYYLNGSTTAVDKGTAVNSATIWDYNGTTGTISTVISGTTYYLQGQLESLQTVNTTNLAITNNSGQATTWTYNNGIITCTISENGNNRTYTLIFYNEKWRLFDVSRYYKTINKTNTTNYMSITTSARATDQNASNASLWIFSTDNTPAQNTQIDVVISTLVNGVMYYTHVDSSLSFTTTSTTLKYGNGSYSGGYYSSGGITDYIYGSRYLEYYSSSWRTYGSLDYDAVMTITKLPFEAATITLTAAYDYNTQIEAKNIASKTSLYEKNSEVISYENSNEDLSIDTTTVIGQIGVRNVRNDATLAITKTTSIDTTRDGSLNFVSKDVRTIVRGDSYEKASSYNAAIALAANDSAPFETKDENTGYIVAGRDSKQSSSIRVSEYYVSNIRTSFNSSSTSTSTQYTSSVDKQLEILTRVNNSSFNGWYRVKDTYNSSNNSVSSSLSGYSKKTVSELGLTRYNEARGQLSDMFLNKTNIYGLHFMNVAIDKNNYYELSKACINGETKTNYQVLANSINFNVKMRGYITLFAGTYYTDNNSFFSLHEVFRDDNDNIIDVKEISKIYSTSGNDYVYKYTDNTYSSTKTPVNLLFDMEWMTNPGSDLKDNAVYYFEIPVNGGEFALGSVNDKYGAYLFYLDIGANGGQTDDRLRTTVTEQYTVIDYSVSIPDGIQLVEAGQSFDENNPYELVTVELDSTFKDEYLLSRTGNVVTPQNKTGSKITYINGELVASDGSGGYYPNGYIKKTIENITDIVVDSSNVVTLTDKMRLETIDYYNSSGTLTKREVTLYAGLESITTDSDIIKIITFSYTPPANDSTYVRVTRAASYAGFNIAFNATTTVNLTTSSIDNEDVHVNFGPNTGSTLIQYDKSTITGNVSREIPLVDMTGASDGATGKNKYIRSVIGSELGTIYCTNDYTTEDTTKATEIATTVTYNPTLGPTNSLPSGNMSQTLTYAFTLTPSSGTMVVGGVINKSSDTTGYDTKLISYSTTANTLVDKKVVYSTIAVTVNDEALSVDSGS